MNLQNRRPHRSSVVARPAWYGHKHYIATYAVEPPRSEAMSDEHDAMSRCCRLSAAHCPLPTVCSHCMPRHTERQRERAMGNEQRAMSLRLIIPPLRSFTIKDATCVRAMLESPSRGGRALRGRPECSEEDDSSIARTKQARSRHRYRERVVVLERERPLRGKRKGFTVCGDAPGGAPARVFFCMQNTRDTYRRESFMRTVCSCPKGQVGKPN